MPCPYPELVGLWVSDDAKNRSNLLANHEWAKRDMPSGCSKYVQDSNFEECSGSILEVNASGNVRYIEMDGLWALVINAGPITSWDGPGGVWTGPCVGCCCCEKGCFHFSVVMPYNNDPSKIHVNGRVLTKFMGQEEEIEVIPIVEAIGDPAFNSVCNSYSPPNKYSV